MRNRNRNCSVRLKDNVKKTGYDTPAYRLSDDGANWVVYNESTGKILKSIKYKPVTESLKKLISQT